MPSSLYLLLIKVAVSESLLCCLAWVFDYVRNGALRNPVGKNLVTKTSILSVLLIFSLLISVFRFSPYWLNIIRWCDLVFVAFIGPVMVWRMIVFHSVGEAMVRCPNGHLVSAAAKFCPECGLLIRTDVLV